MICEDDGVESVKNLLGDIKAGLMDRSGQQLPLQAVSVKCKLMDLLSQVVIFQTYTNLSSVPIEAKYVFPLADSAAVCGFEAFINGKHVVGQVKEKETARKEYKQAVEKGHGAYLMDQDAPDVFTISVGNLMPGATVLIKVTFVSELIVKDGSILFSLPGSVAPWQESAALNQTTQVSLEKVYVTEEAASKREFTLDMSIEMAYEITGLHCTTHKIKIKQTDCKAVVSVLPGEVIGPEGFQLSVTLLNVHLPRMWVENHPDKDTQACMLVFYPDFEINPSSASDEVVLMLDTSESMRGEPLHTAQRIALHVLKTLDDNLKINVILFGTDHLQAFVAARPLVEARQAAESFIKNTSQVGGSTELWRPLRSLSLLPLSHGIRNLLLLSDGHIQSAQLTLQLIRDNAQHSRLFTCGFSSTANRYMLRALAQAGGGAYEFFDTKSKHKWAEKVACQVKQMASPGCSSVAVKWQQFNPTAPPPVQAPKQLHALFNDCHTLVYGFVPHCMQATLLGNLSGQELKTMVSTSELQKTKGTFLHKLTARALIRDYEDGNLDSNEGEHEGQKAELKSFIIDLSKEFSILSQFTSFVAIEERDSRQTDQGFTDIPKVISKEDVDILPYMSWSSQLETEEELACITLFPQSDSESLDFGSLSCDMYEMCEMESDEETYSTSPPPQDSLMRLQGSTVSLPLKIQTSADIDVPIETGRLHRGAVLNTRLPPPPPPLLSHAVVTSDLSGPPPPPPPPLSQAVVNSDSGTPRRYFRTSFMSTSFTPVHPSSDVVEPPPANSLSLMVEPPQFQAHEDDHVVHSRCRMRKKRLSVEYIAFEERALHTGAAAAAADIPALAFPYANAGISFGATASQSEQAADIPATGFCFGARPSFAQADIQATGFSFGARATHIKPAAADIPASGFCFGARPSFAQADIPATAFPPDVPAEGALNRLKKIKRLSRRSSRASSAPQSSEPLEISPEQSARRRRLSWIKIFQMQHSEGYWELTTELGSHINMDVDLFANVFLTNKGIASLGVKAHADILKLVATLLVLQLMRVQRLEEGDLLRTLFCLEDSAHHRTEWWEKVKRAVDWVRWADQQYPCVYSRLEFGLSWESSTRQLLGYEGLAPFSALSGLKLQLRPSATLVH